MGGGRSAFASPLAVVWVFLLVVTVGARAQEPLEVYDPDGGMLRRVDVRGQIDDVAPAPGDVGTTRVVDRSVVPDPEPPPPSTRLTIDTMTTSSWVTRSWIVGGGLDIVGRAETYYLSDWSNFRAGAGTFQFGSATLQRVEVDGETIRYVFDPPVDGVLHQQTSFGFGDHSAQGTLVAAGPLVLEAVRGATNATMRGETLILANDESRWGEPRFKYYSAIVGAVVPFQVNYQIVGGIWTETSFDTDFSYRYQGYVDFAEAVSTPALESVAIFGGRQLPEQMTVQLGAVATFENGVTKPVTVEADWSVEPAGPATVAAGLVSVPSRAEAETITLRVTYEELGRQASAEQTLPVLPDGALGLATSWATYQGNARHDGYVPRSLEPELFELLWQRDVAPGRALNPVVEAEDQVFASVQIQFDDETHLFALDARDGVTMWTKGFGDIYSANPPAAAYGNVYIQIGDSGDTRMRAFDGLTGAPVFDARHKAQWERYYAPTIVDGVVYVNGGHTGGAYAFDAFSGAEQWFLNLPQYDEWTPAVDDTYLYAYVGRNPGLHVADRETGALQFIVPDPNFDWNGWSMDLAPVLGDAGVLAIHGGRLINFDPVGRIIAWELDLGFRGQPAARRGEVYASTFDGLLVLDEATGNPQWSWAPPNDEEIVQPIIVTDSHVLVSTDQQVYAISLLSRVTEWSYPMAGSLALGEGTLYIASETGTLAAIDLGGFEPSPPVRLDIAGPTALPESSSTPYAATVTYADGRERDRTPVVEWTLETGAPATISSDGVLEIGELIAPMQRIVVTATYTELGVTVEDSIEIAVAISVDARTFVERSLAKALAIQERVADDLAEAMILQESVRAALEVSAPDGFDPASSHARRARSLTKRAMGRTRRGIRASEQCIESLEDAISVLTGP